MREPILIAKNLHKTFHYPAKAPILRGIDLVVYPGESVAIMGRSGEGKSTLLNILGTLDTACEGALQIAGYDVSSFNKTILRNRHIGFVFQSFHLLDDYSALENLLMPAQIARKPTSSGSEAYAKGLALLDHVGLTDRAHFNAKQLSGGEKQRVGIARAFCNDPSILFADEPSGNLDRKNAENIHDLLLNFSRQKGKALILVTHDPDLASLCDTQYRLEEGLLFPGP